MVAEYIFCLVLFLVFMIFQIVLVGGFRYLYTFEY